MEPHQPAAAFARRFGVGVWVFESLFVRWDGCEVVEEGLSRRLHRGQRAFLAAPILVVSNFILIPIAVVVVAG